MNITINLVTFLVILIFLMGYIAIIISFLHQTDSKSQKESFDYQNQLAKTTQLLESRSTEIINLRSRINLLDNKITDNIPKKTETVSNFPVKHTGVIILGMHRSGTSILGGLMNKMGLKTGGPLIQPAEDNEKGFFERIDVVLQNDQLMKRQRVHYAMNTENYNPQIGLKDILNEKDTQFFNEGRRGLAFLNNPTSVPWMLKDPRLCITFRTWLPLLNSLPAILFTYRHPLDVALSMHKREFEQFEISRGLRLWYVYTMRAIQQSNDLCRVTTSHRQIMQHPQEELTRIREELIHTCGVEVPHPLTQEDISSFIDLKLQHGRTTLLKDHSCSSDLSTLNPPETWPAPHSEKQLAVYREAIRVYCALEDKSAYSIDFKWDLTMKDHQ